MTGEVQFSDFSPAGQRGPPPPPPVPSSTRPAMPPPRPPSRPNDLAPPMQQSFVAVEAVPGLGTQVHVASFRSVTDSSSSSKGGLSRNAKIGLATVVAVLVIIAIAVGVAFGTGAVGGSGGSSNGAASKGGDAAVGGEYIAPDPTQVALDVTLAFDRTIEQAADSNWRKQVSNGVCSTVYLPASSCEVISVAAGSVIATIRLTPPFGISIASLEPAIASLKKAVSDKTSPMLKLAGFKEMDTTRGFETAPIIRTPPVPPPITRPKGPNFDENAPASITLMDYVNEAAPVAVGTIAFDKQVEDLKFDHPWLDESIGLTSVKHCTKTIVWGEFEFGAMFTAQSPDLNAEGNFPVYQLMVAGKPYGRWATYPRRRTWNPEVDVNHPPAFKILIHDAKKRLIGTIQMQDGLPINSPKLSRTRGGVGQPLRVFWHIGQMLKWQNAKHKPNQNMRKWIGGFTPDSIRPSQAKIQHSTNGAIVMLARTSGMRTQVNGVNQWHAMPKWPLGSDNTVQWDGNYDPNVDDPWLFPVTNTARMPAAFGFGYEPGQCGGHDHMTGPGGQRVDRAPIATPYAMFYADENSRHRKTNTSMREMAEHWGDNFFNHGGFWTTDLTNFASVPMDEVHRTRWSFSKPYYGSQLREIPDGDKTAWDYNVELRVAAQGSWDGDTAESKAAAVVYYHNKNGEAHWNGWGVDSHHAYQFGGWHTLMFSSAVHMFAMRAGFIWNRMSWLSGKTIGRGNFMYRVHAFRWGHLTHAWIMSNSHSTFGMDRTKIEETFHDDCARLVKDLKAAHDKPVDLTDHMLARFGGHAGGDETATIDGVAMKRMALTQSSLGYYMTYPLAMMKTSGFWAKMRQNTTTAECLDWIIAKYDQYCFGKIVYGKGRMSWQSPAITKWMPAAHKWTVDDLPKDWQDWATNYYPSTEGPNETIVKFHNGTMKSGNNEYAASHIEVAYALMRRDYFPEIPHPLLKQAWQHVEQAYADVAANVRLQQGFMRASGADWTYRFPSLGFLAKPTVPV